MDTICAEAFSSCESLRKVTFQEMSQLESIMEKCFRGSGLEEFIAPPGLKEIGDEAFKSCKSLKRVVLNEGLTTLPGGFNGVFQWSGLEEITLPSTLEEIGNSCFAYTCLTEITLPKTLKEIGCGTFEYCSNFKVVHVEDGCEASLCNAGLPDSVKIGPPPKTMLGSTRIWDLRKLKDVVIPDGIERIGS